MKSYVLGFLFNDKEQVWLIQKTKPEWQTGKLNGIGGKVEDNEDYSDAMVREFKEEAGLNITDWKRFCVITDDEEYQIICYVAFSNGIPQTTTDEVVGLYPANNLPNNVLFNAYWLIPMALKARGYEYVVKECFKIEHHDERNEIKPVVVQEEEEEEDLSWLEICEQCDEQAWDGRICHNCGAKNI